MLHQKIKIVKSESCTIQDEPERRNGFQYNLSLKCRENYYFIYLQNNKKTLSFLRRQESKILITQIKIPAFAGMTNRDFRLIIRL